MFELVEDVIRISEIPDVGNAICTTSSDGPTVDAIHHLSVLY
jgi:hypothetical protein